MLFYSLRNKKIFFYSVRNKKNICFLNTVKNFTSNSSSIFFWYIIATAVCPKLSARHRLNWWAKSAAKFATLGYPRAVAALDGKHVRIKKPKKSGSLYYNYKGFCSLVLQAVVNPQMTVMLFDAGGQGRQSDSGLFGSSRIRAFLEAASQRSSLELLLWVALLLFHMLALYSAMGEEN